MSTIKLYRNCKITEEKNFQVDNLSDYLSTLDATSKSYSTAQYVKQGLDAEVKVVLNQDYLDDSTTNNYNYCSISNNGINYYYFIRNKIWISKDCIKLILRLDTLNTYRGKYEFTDKTNILREHKDRFEKTTYPAHSEEFTTYLDDSEWNWGSGSGEIIGKAIFDLSSSEFINRNSEEFTFSALTIQGEGADYYEYDINPEENKLQITAYVQGELSPIPEGRVKFTVSVAVKYTDIYKKIDLQSEGFDAPQFKIEEDKIIEYSPVADLIHDSIYDSNKYYLIYKTANAYTTGDNDKFVYDNPIDCYICADNDSKWITSSGTEVTHGSLVEPDNSGSIICFPTGATGKKLGNSFPAITDAETVPHEVNVKIYYNNDYIKSTTVKSYWVNNNNHRLKQICLMLYSYNGVYHICRCKLKRDNFPDGYPIFEPIYSFTDLSKIKLEFDTPQVKIYHTTDTSNFWNDSGSWFRRYFDDHQGTTETFSAGVASVETVKGLYSWDRTDPQIAKIIELPYNPFDRGYSTHGTLLYSSGNLKYDFSENRFPEVITRDISFSSDISPAKELYFDNNKWITSETFSRNDLRKVDWGILKDYEVETKLLHSDFQHYDFVYDSFKYTFYNEFADIKGITESISSSFLKCEYTVSNTVSSTFMFSFNKFFPVTISSRDYNDILIVNRNNEVPIYNNYYLNYLRNGYNYDVKNKEQQQVASGIGMGLSAASLAVGIALSATGVGSAVGSGAIIGGISGIAGSLAGTINSSISADKNLQQKLEQSKNQSASVKGADDIGLLGKYTDGNKAKIVHYRVSTETYAKLADFFHYCGYKCDYQGIPDTTSRFWFNFIQCEPVFKENTSTAKISNDIKQDLINRYKSGVTVLHKQLLEDEHEQYYDYWDFEQERVNYETWLTN